MTLNIQQYTKQHFVAIGKNVPRESKSSGLWDVDWCELIRRMK
jgi:hypothetical protein